MTLAMVLGGGMARAEPGPTMNQVYEAAKAGKYEQAETMMQQVLVEFPNSAKAHFVRAELLARQGKVARAREALGTAEKLAPGLPFAKPESVQSLRTQLATKVRPPASANAELSSPRAPAHAKDPFPWPLAAVLAAAAIAIGAFFVMRRKPASATESPWAPPHQEQQLNAGLNGAQNFGRTGGFNAAAESAATAGAAGGTGGRVMGGLATGLAIGAGVMAVQAIGKSLTGNETKSDGQTGKATNTGEELIGGNKDLGGQNFGISTPASWDDGNSVASGVDGADWES